MFADIFSMQFVEFMVHELTSISRHWLLWATSGIALAWFWYRCQPPRRPGPQYAADTPDLADAVEQLMIRLRSQPDPHSRQRVA